MEGKEFGISVKNIEIGYSFMCIYQECLTTENDAFRWTIFIIWNSKIYHFIIAEFNSNSFGNLQLQCTTCYRERSNTKFILHSSSHVRLHGLGKCCHVNIY